MSNSNFRGIVFFFIISNHLLLLEQSFNHTFFAEMVSAKLWIRENNYIHHTVQVHAK